MKEWVILALSILLAGLCWFGGFLHGSTRMAAPAQAAPAAAAPPWASSAPAQAAPAAAAPPWASSAPAQAAPACDWLEENNLLNEEAIERYKIED